MTSVAAAKSFDRIAATYDDVRPGYPPAVYDRIIHFGSLTPAIKVLEVGVGTGKATLPLAERDFEICGIEPGTELSRRARANLSRFPRVAIQTTSFEAWNVERGAFGLAFVAQAYHWLDQLQRLPRLAATLDTNGVLAIFGNVPSVPAGRLRDELDVAYRELSPSLVRQGRAESWYTAANSPVLAELYACDSFYDVQFDALDWERPLSASAYGQLLSTYSDHSTLPADELAALLARVASIIEDHGGELTLSYRTGLFLARRR
jgi:SAM-dependent methyltransferase